MTSIYVRRSHAAIMIAAAIAVVCVQGTARADTSGALRTPAAQVTTATTAASTPQQLFAPTSVWNAPVPANAPLDPYSAGIVAHLNAFVQTDEQQQIGPWINTTSYSTPLYVVGATQPAVPVYTSQGGPLASAFAAVPLPSDAQPAAGTDAQLTVYQPSSDTLWEFFHMSHQLLPPLWLGGSASTGGTLMAGTYYYAVSALSAAGETTVSPIAHFQAPAQSKVTLWWAGPVGSTGYNIYRGTDPAHLYLLATFSHNTTAYNDPGATWIDTGSRTPGTATPPTRNTATTPTQWNAAYGGRILHVSQSPGYYQKVLDPSANVLEASTWGATATSLPISAGLITLADLASGHINHAIQLMVPQAKAGSYVCPAQRTDGHDTSANAVPEGAHFRLDPTLNLAAIKMPPITRMIAQAAQTYGLIVDDQTGAAVGFRAEDPTPLIRAGQPNPYPTYFGGQYPTQFLASFPWSHLQLLAPPASCT